MPIFQSRKLLWSFSENYYALYLIANRKLETIQVPLYRGLVQKKKKLSMYPVEYYTAILRNETFALCTNMEKFQLRLRKFLKSKVQNI